MIRARLNALRSGVAVRAGCHEIGSHSGFEPEHGVVGRVVPTRRVEARVVATTHGFDYDKLVGFQR